MPSHVPLYYPAPSVFGDLLPSPVVIYSPLEVGRLGAAVYDGATQLGMVTPILSASTDEAINEVGVFTFTVPAERAELITDEVEIELVREGEGRVMPRGIVASIQHIIQDDKYVKVVTCNTLAIELLWASTYRSAIYRDESAAAVLAGLIDGTGWTSQLTGSGYLNINRRWDDTSRFAALNDFASMEKAYIRETLTAREIEVKNTSSPANMRLGQLESVNRQLPERMGLVKSLTVTEEVGNVWNRIMPFAKADGDVILDLERANRSSPYTISSKVTNPARISQVMNLVDAATSGIGDHFAANGSAHLTCLGEGRMAVAIFAQQSTSSTGLPQRVTLNGKRMTGPLVLPGTSHRVMRWALQNPDVGQNKIGVEYDVSGPPVNGVWTFISAENVWFLTNNGETATGTGPSLPAEANSLMLSFLAHSSATATPGSGQTLVSPSAAVVTAGLERLARLSYKQSPTSGTIGWTLGSSVAFAHLSIELAYRRTYYIQDTASQAKFGLREKPLPLGEYRPVDGSNIVVSSNALYDKAADFLNEHKEPARFYQVKVSYLPLGPREWLVGDSIPLRYTKPGLTVDETLICTRRAARYDADGNPDWDLTLATVARHQKTQEETFANVIGRLDAVQTAQV